MVNVDKKTQKIEVKLAHRDLYPNDNYQNSLLLGSEGYLAPEVLKVLNLNEWED